MRYRYELLSASTWGEYKARQFALKCWRATITCNDYNGADLILDGQPIGITQFSSNPAGPAGIVVNALTITLGGIILPNGTPVQIDQILRIVAVTREVGLFIVREWLE